MPKPKKRIMPVLYLKMAHKLKKGKKRAKIAREISEKYGIPFDSARTTLGNVFPMKEVKTNKDIERLLWEKRETILSKKDRSEIVRKSLMKKLSSEQRSGRLKKGWKNLSPQKRASRIAGLKPKRNSIFDSIRITAIENIIKLPIKKRNVAYVAGLKPTNFLSRQQRIRLMKRLAITIEKISEQFSGRRDFKDIRQQIYLGAWEALRKWNGKVSLTLLLINSIKLHLIDYLRYEENYSRKINSSEKVRKKLGLE